MEVVFVARVSHVYALATVGSIDAEAHAVIFDLYSHDILGADPTRILRYRGARIGDAASGISPMMIHFL